MTSEEVTALIHASFPEAGERWRIVDLVEDRVTLDYRTDPSMLRPGGTISGPSQMAIMDVAAFIMVLGAVGPAELAGTSSLHMSFLRRPRPGIMRCTGTLLKLGRSLAVIDAHLYNTERSDLSGGADDPSGSLVAHAELTYSMALVGQSPTPA